MRFFVRPASLQRLSGRRFGQPKSGLLPGPANHSILRRMDGWPRLMLASAAAIAIIVSIDSLAEMLLEGNTTSFATWFFLGAASVIGSAGAEAPDAQKASR